jgi:hypothetical protein
MSPATTRVPPIDATALQAHVDLKVADLPPQLAAFVARYPVRMLECGCWLWAGGKAGNYKGGLRYGRVRFGGPSRYTHRVTFELMHGPLPPGTLLARRVTVCDYDHCCNPAHWRRSSRAELNRDKARTGRTSRGRPHSVAVTVGIRRTAKKLDLERAREIRASTEPARVLAARFGVDVSMVYGIRRGKFWAEPSPFSALVR